MSIPPGPAIGLCRRTAPVGTEIAQSVPGVDGLDSIRVRQSGLALWVDIHVEVEGDVSVRTGHEIRQAPVPLVKYDESGAYNRAVGSAVHKGVREVLFEGFDARFYFAEPAR